MKSLLVACIVCACFTVNAQQHATQSTQCQLAVDEILSMQSFDIDDPVSEDARYIFQEMYEELNLIYQTNGSDPALVGYVDNFKETLTRAEDLELNVSMFQGDISHVESLNL
ncbi:MAG: hypothetical protein NXI10_12860 [bacterium]|nr:hypothetical protein [bacterium]